jgi:beta-lactamase class D
MRIFTTLFLTSTLLLLTPASDAEELCTLIVHADSGDTVLGHGSRCAMRVTPASTFKLAISLMGFDSGVLVDEKNPSWPYQAGYPDWAGDAWRRDIDPAAWMKISVFWYSQQVLKKLGQDRFEKYVETFEYGNKDVSAVRVQNPGSNGVWVMSSLQISPAEQISFLRKLVSRQLSVSQRAYEMTANIALQDVQMDGWRVYGKTGTGSPGQDNKYRADQAYGWYVGWAGKGTQTLVFAKLIQDEKAQTPNAGIRARDQLLEQLSSAVQGLR